MCETHSQERDIFGLSRTYKNIPSSVPDDPSAASYIPGYSHPEPCEELQTNEEIIAPYPNMSSFLFDHHFWTGSTSKSRNDWDALQALITSPSFHADDLRGVNLHSIEEDLRGCSSRNNWEQQRGWRKSPLYIRISTGKKQTAQTRRADAAHQARVRNAPCPPPSTKANLDGFPLDVGNLDHRSICEVIHETFSSDLAARSFHYHPYKKTYHSPTDPESPPERVYDEVYTSDAWICEDARIQTIKLSDLVPERNLPRSIAAMMVWSDGTVINPFGQNKAWPVYLFFGNQPKREQSALSAGGGRHLAYLPEVSKLLPWALSHL